MNSAVGILAIIFVFILIIVSLDQSYKLKKIKLKEETQQKESTNNFSRDQVSDELDKLEKRIDNLEIILREKHGN